MKILHTSDWHIGQHFYRFERDDEHRYFVTQLIEIVQREIPDAIVVSGDIFDNAVPSVTAQNLYVQSMMAIHQALPSATIVVTAGNHDSGTRLDVTRPLWNLLNVKVVGNYRRKEDGTFYPDDFLVPVEGKGTIVAVPYFHEYNYPPAQTDMERGDRQPAFYAAVMQAALQKSAPGLPIVMMAHLALQGSDFQGHELSVIGGMEQTKAEVMGNNFDYLALGHIHKAQNLSERIRYSGSPFPLSFSEDYPHSVSIVDIPTHGAVPRIKEEIIKPLRDIKTIEAETLETALKELEAVSEDVYVRLLITQEGLLPPDAEQRAQLVVRNKLCKLCEVRKPLIRKSLTSSKQNEDYDLTAPDCHITPADIAKRYFMKQHQTEMPSRLFDMLEDVIREVNNDSKD